MSWSNNLFVLKTVSSKLLFFNARFCTTGKRKVFQNEEYRGKNKCVQVISKILGEVT